MIYLLKHYNELFFLLLFFLWVNLLFTAVKPLRADYPQKCVKIPYDFERRQNEVFKGAKELVN